MLGKSKHLLSLFYTGSRGSLRSRKDRKVFQVQRFIATSHKSRGINKENRYTGILWRVQLLCGRRVIF